MKDWWKAREPREQWLLLLGGGVALTVLIFQYVWEPSTRFVSQQRTVLATALSERADVRRAVSNRVDGPMEPRSQQPLQLLLTQTADLYGLTLSRIVPAEDNGFNVWLDEARPVLFYAWVAELEREYGVRVGKASLRRNSDERTVNANIYMSRNP